MYISKINIMNFRSFKNQEILFGNGVNVVIGHNNAGKTNLLKALAMVIDPAAKRRLDVHDFHKHIPIKDLKANPPAVLITVTFSSGEDEKDDLRMVADWLTKPDAAFEAKLSYEFFLPDAEHQSYFNAVKDIEEADKDACIKVWSFIQHDFIRHYKYRLLAGAPEEQRGADYDATKGFDFQFLDAIRDVERDMHTGRNALLREVLDFFMDYEVKSLDLAIHTKEKKEEQIRVIRRDFAQKSSDLMAVLKGRMESGKVQILEYAHGTGASFDGAKPDFDGTISDVELFSALRLIVEHSTGIKIPATHNGLGYNNLIYMSLLLAKMQMNSDVNYMGGNSKIFAVLAIEEPEAHLHPAMQYKFLKFLKLNRKKKKVRQVFIISHSAHITAAVDLDEIICISSINGDCNVAYPGKVFPADGKSKLYVQRFLDATKSEMLFARSIIFVEGLAEQMLMSVFAQYHGKPLEDAQIAVVNVGGRYFEHFLHLFKPGELHTIKKTVACVTDRDPEKKFDDGYEKCYPFEVLDVGEYRQNPVLQRNNDEKIRYFSQDAKFGKTFEYDLIRYNPTLELLLGETVSNLNELKKLMEHVTAKSSIGDMTAEFHKGKETKRIASAILLAHNWTDDEKRVAIVASRYLNAVGKGENAIQLANSLLRNLSAPIAEKKAFLVPDYIRDAIDWAHT
ncbi:ATP-dependent nuclease [Massilia rubra]|uniref:AAA family ATPase n=1 Tax=Massilia rubra TaxID=2607910 RepID=A0ABX0LLQ6_9BURK|nr:AAA family ATPase [Massilia rubra]NHZ32872.1 AAA family ATPase [Massilia rubra]